MNNQNLLAVALVALFANAGCILEGGDTDTASSFAYINAVTYTGQGTTADESGTHLNTEICGIENGAPVEGPYLLWVLTATKASNATGLSSMTFNGTNVLAAGTYYLAMNYNGVQLAPSPSTDGRWHVRSTAGDNGFNFSGEILVQNASCGNNFCCLSDYNGDGDVGTDQDIADFFACLGGNCCATCPQDADFNCDGDVGTDADIASFFSVLAGGNC